ncbi:MAG: hypothetical protein SFW08_03595 [Gemmatimonadaceae bacterium]|nr:hypothetical protein [Gemmatimonadaceae bacterium]
MRPRHLGVVTALVGLALGVPVSAGAQVPGGRCVMVFDNTPTTRLTSVMTASRRYNSFIGGGVFGRCQGQDVTIKSDSAEFYEDSNVLYLIGAVRYREPRANLDARRLTYYLNDERLFAEGDVFVTLPSGTTMKGPVMDYFRAVPGIRKESRMNAPLRSRTQLVQRDTAKARVAQRRGASRDSVPADTVIVNADRTTSVNDSLVYLGGKVEIDRTDLKATSDSAFLDAGREFAQLIRRATVKGTGDRGYTLDSQIIDLFSTDRALRRVVAKGNGHAVSKEMDLKSDTIFLDVDSSRIERARAWGPTRAIADSPERRILADSLDVRMPRQQVRLVYAHGKAFAEMRPDTVKLRSDERDWVRGDTIVARFDSLATSDTARQPRLREMVATGNASSFYQVASREGPTAGPAMNYVRGRVITVEMDSAAVRQVTVLEQAIGLYLEPDSTAVAKPLDGPATKGGNDAPRRPRPGAGGRPTTGAARPERE